MDEGGWVWDCHVSCEIMRIDARAFCEKKSPYRQHNHQLDKKTTSGNETVVPFQSNLKTLLLILPFPEFTADTYTYQQYDLIYTS